jgi:hypothetical protein
MGGSPEQGNHAFDPDALQGSLREVLPTGLRARASQRRIPAMSAVVAQVGIRLQLERDEPVALKGQAA